jgi:hypothetical protein
MYSRTPSFPVFAMIGAYNWAYDATTPSPVGLRHAQHGGLSSFQIDVEHLMQ